MTARLDANGVLTITSENALESYALSCWHRHFLNGNKNIDGSRLAELTVNTVITVKAR